MTACFPPSALRISSHSTLVDASIQIGEVGREKTEIKRSFNVPEEDRSASSNDPFTYTDPCCCAEPEIPKISLTSTSFCISEKNFSSASTHISGGLWTTLPCLSVPLVVPYSGNSFSKISCFSYVIFLAS